MVTSSTRAEKARHPSYIRLMHAAREATRGRRDAVTSQDDLAVAFEVTPAAVSLWSNPTRGVSAQIAVQAQRLWGVSPAWVLYGEGDPNASTEVRPTLDQAMACIGDALDQADEITRLQARPLLRALVDGTHERAEVIRAVCSVLQEPEPAPGWPEALQAWVQLHSEPAAVAEVARAAREITEAYAGLRQAHTEKVTRAREARASS